MATVYFSSHKAVVWSTAVLPTWFIQCLVAAERDCYDDGKRYGVMQNPHKLWSYCRNSPKWKCSCEDISGSVQLQGNVESEGFIKSHWGWNGRPYQKFLLNELCNSFHYSERFQAIDPHLYTCKKNVSFHICGPRELWRNTAFYVLWSKNLALDVTPALGLDPSFKMALIPNDGFEKCFFFLIWIMWLEYKWQWMQTLFSLFRELIYFSAFLGTNIDGSEKSGWFLD